MDQLLPWSPILSGLMVLSAGCSASEAAFFSLTPEQLNAMRTGSAAERRGAQLMERSDRLLSTLLFSNLIANMLYFGIVSVVTLKIQSESAALAGAVSVGALLTIIIFCELIPKAVAVLIPLTFVRFAAFPLSFLELICSPFLPILGLGKELSLRLFLPRLRQEPILDLADLEQAVSVAQESGGAVREKECLRSLIRFSEMSAEEIMRPRTHLPVFSVPFSVGSLRELESDTELVFLEEEGDGDAVDRVFALEKLAQIPESGYDSLENFAESAYYVPWCLPAANLLEVMQKEGISAAVVVDEYGATPGAVLLSDILETIFSPDSERVFQLTDRNPMEKIGEDQWRISGLFSVRAFCRCFRLKFPEELESATLGGLAAEKLQKIPEEGDSFQWNGFLFQVVSAGEFADMVLEASRNVPEKNGEADPNVP